MITIRSLTLSTIVVLIILLSTLSMLYRGIETMRFHQSLLMHTNKVLTSLELILSGMRDAETGMRGFAIAGRELFLEPYHAGRQSALQHLQQVRELTRDNALQQENSETLQSALMGLLAWQAEVIRVGRDDGIESAREHIIAGRGKEQMDNIRLLVQGMKDSETKLLAQRAEHAEESQQRINWSFLVIAAVLIFLSVLTYYLIRSHLIKLKVETARLEMEAWLKGGSAELSDKLRGEQSLSSLGERALAFFSSYLGAKVGAFYTLQAQTLEIAALYARPGDASVHRRINLTESLLGEAVRQRRIIEMTDVPESYVKVRSALGEAQPKKLLIVPIFFEGEPTGVVELGFVQDPPPYAFMLLESLKESIGISLNAALSRAQLQALLEETQTQSEELQAQQEELKTNNEELEQQAVALRHSQDRLQVQQEELQQSNEELEQQARVLDAQKAALAKQNLVLSETQASLEEKAKDLEISSRYKSEFLANMSHELRTPLNSLLILSTLLAENKEKSLSEKQVEFAKTIFKSGSDLLSLINDVLDLSKVEAGKLDLHTELISISSIIDNLEIDFRHQAENKGLRFLLQVDDELKHRTLLTDRQRLEQILKNLLSNAVKFTQTGQVCLRARQGDEDLPIVFEVEDSGIGIAEDKQVLIFEAFQQGDGSTSRAYGGTGLGLTISRELAHLLGGIIEVQSHAGRGSLFTLRLPMRSFVSEEGISRQGGEKQGGQNIVTMSGLGKNADDTAKDVETGRDLHTTYKLLGDDLQTLTPSDRLLLIIEDDVEFGKTLIDVAHASGFKALLATSGGAGLDFAVHHPVSAVILDVKLPDVSGLIVLERLKNSPSTRHVPIHMLSGADYSQNALSLGAMGYLLKPPSMHQLQTVFEKIGGLLDRQVKQVLVIEDDKIQRQAILSLLGNGDIKTDEAGSGAEAKEKLATKVYDCIVLDLRLPDITGFELLEELDRMLPVNRPPVVVYTGRDLSHAEQDQLRKYSESIIIKGARSPERLLDEVTLFLHRVETKLPANSQALLQKMRSTAEGLKGRRILVVDDDMRNVYALVNALEASGVKSIVARNGQEALDQLDKDREIELVLMDIMMPVMDGYEAMGIIRSDDRFKKLPIIALTARAMKGDQEKCLAAGASDYLSKPVNLERLLSLLKVWLPQKV